MYGAYVAASAAASHRSDNDLLGELAARLPFAVKPKKRTAWEYRIQHLRQLVRELPEAFFALEFMVPRMGRRADAVVLHEAIILAVEYKLGACQFDRSNLDQVYGYGLDLKHFHGTCHPYFGPVSNTTSEIPATRQNGCGEG